MLRCSDVFGKSAWDWGNFNDGRASLCRSALKCACLCCTAASVLPTSGRDAEKVKLFDSWGASGNWDSPASIVAEDFWIELWTVSLKASPEYHHVLVCLLTTASFFSMMWYFCARVLSFSLSRWSFCDVMQGENLTIKWCSDAQWWCWKNYWTEFMLIEIQVKEWHYLGQMRGRKC